MPTATTRPESLPQPVLDAFPTRPVVVRPGGVPLASVFVLVLLAGTALVAAVLSWRSLAPDYAMRDDSSLASQSGVDGSCTIRAYFLYTCDVTIAYVHDGEVREADRRYLWVDHNSTADYQRVVVSPDGTHATLELAEDRIMNRTLTSVGFVLTFLWLAGFIAHRARRVLRVRKRYGVADGLPLRPVPAHLHKLVGKSRIGGPTPVFEVEVDGRRHRPVHLLPGSESVPLCTSSGLVVAVAPADGSGEPVLLDADLTGLELSDDERTALLSAVASS